MRARDFPGLLAAGGNIYFLLKLGVVTGNGLYDMGAKMRGETYEQFLATRNERRAPDGPDHRWHRHLSRSLDRRRL